MNPISLSEFLLSRFPELSVVTVPAVPAQSQLETAPCTPARRRRRWKRFAGRRGRPCLLTEEIADSMYESILTRGVTDSRAGLLAKVSTSTVSRWKQEDPMFADFLETAHAKFELAQIKMISDTPPRNSQQDAQNAKWLLQYSNPERWGGRPRKPPTSAPRRRTRTVSAASVAAAPESALFVTHQQSKSLQNIPEIPAASAAFRMGRAPSPAETAACGIGVRCARGEKAEVLAVGRADAVACGIAARGSNWGNSERGEETPSQTPSAPASISSEPSSTPPIDPAENEAGVAAISSHFATPESALLHPRQQSKSLQNIPETPAPSAAKPMGGASSWRTEVLVAGRAERGEKVPRAVSAETLPKTPSCPTSLATKPTPASQTTAAAGAAAIRPCDPAPESVLLHHLQQSKSTQNIPEIQAASVALNPAATSPVPHLSRKQRRREAHLARRAASKAARASRRYLPFPADPNVTLAAPSTEIAA